MSADHGFVEKLRRALRSFPPTERYLIGVSGGRDSVALLDALVTVGYGRLIVCHLDHGLRGAAARTDARFVLRLAGRFGLESEMGRADVPTLAKERRLSLEAAARTARYEFFAAVAGRRRCRTLFLAHQADDQVETFLFNLLRGAGPAGLGAMAPESERLVGKRTLRIVRPLLGVWRAEVDEYLQTHRLRWREDHTNADPIHATRNRLRLEVLPLLEQAMGREVKPALWRAADLLRAEEGWLARLAASALPSSVDLPTRTLAGEPVAKQRRMIHAWLERHQVPRIGYREVEAVRSLLDKAVGPAKVNLPGNHHARRRQGCLFIDASDTTTGGGDSPGRES